MNNKFFTSIKKLSVKDIASIVEAEIIGDDSIMIDNIASLEVANDSSLCFFNNLSFINVFETSSAAACFVDSKYKNKPTKIKTLLVVKDPYLAYAKMTNIMYPYKDISSFVSEKAIISSGVKLGKNVHIDENAVIKEGVTIGNNCYIGPNTIIYEGVQIGDNCHIFGNVSIKYAQIGNNCIIHDGVRIGTDGFGFVFNPSGHVKIQQIGYVIIEDSVEIGANSAIDRGAINPTLIKEGTKLDNLVHIAHNVNIGKHCFIAGQSGIAGGSVIEDYVSLGGQVGIGPHLKIATGSRIAVQSGVTHSIEEPGKIWMGYPAIKFNSFWKLQVLLKKILKKNT